MLGLGLLLVKVRFRTLIGQIQVKDSYRSKSGLDLLLVKVRFKTLIGQSGLGLLLDVVMFRPLFI